MHINHLIIENFCPVENEIGTNFTSVLSFGQLDPILLRPGWGKFCRTVTQNVLLLFFYILV